MICKNCGAFFVRYPCPSCGETSQPVITQADIGEKLRKPSDIRKDTMNKTDESTHQVNEEALIRPSQYQSKVGKELTETDKSSEEMLLRPSQLQKTPLREQKEQNIATEEQLIRPSQLRGRSAVNPDYERRTSTTSSTLQKQQVILKKEKLSTIQPLQQHLKPIENKLNKIKHQVNSGVINSNLKTKGETEEEFKIRVRETLLEVMSLLEKLVE